MSFVFTILFWSTIVILSIIVLVISPNVTWVHFLQWLLRFVPKSWIRKKLVFLLTLSRAARLFPIGCEWYVVNTFRIRPTDIQIVTFPKCGTTWMQQIAHGLRTRGSMDFEEISIAVPWLITGGLLNIDMNAEQVANPRLFKGHTAYDSTIKGGKYIVVFRNPVDAVISFYNFFGGWIFDKSEMTLDEFFEAQPQFVTNWDISYWNFVSSWWEQRNDPNTLIIFYENMIQNLEETVRRVAAFMEIEADKALIDLVVEQSSFDFMKKHQHQFDDHLVTERVNERFGVSKFTKITKVASGPNQKSSEKLKLSPKSIATLETLWVKYLYPVTKCKTYDEFRSLFSTKTIN